MVIKTCFVDARRRLGIPSPLGGWCLESLEGALTSLEWLEGTHTAPSNVLTQPESELEHETVGLLRRYFQGEPVTFNTLPLHLEGTPFQQSVWRSLATIPYGETRSYQWLAEQTGSPKASRAVGGALGRNPLPIILPCHRVITSAGGLGGFMSGRGADALGLKAALLTLEGTVLGTADRCPALSKG